LKLTTAIVLIGSLVWAGNSCSAQKVIPAQTSVFQSLVSRPATSRPPAKLFVGTRVFEVGMLEPQYMVGNDGVTLCDKNLILINVDTSEIRMRQAFMHEALHAMFCSDTYKPHWWTRNTERRHKDIYYMGPALAEILRDNPYLTHWLATSQ
jgi:hypothetical protein